MDDHEYLRRSILRIQQARADLEQYLSEPMAIHPASRPLVELEISYLKDANIEAADMTRAVRKGLK